MAAKPLPRIRAGISGSPVLTSKRSVSLPGKSKSQDFRNQTKHHLIANPHENSISDDGKKSPEPILNVAQTGKPMITSQKNNKKVCTSPSLLEKMESELDNISSQAEMERLSVNANDMAKHSPEGSNLADEVARLKQLMMLQVSLISRQQDLLKLRDKEILHLKTTTQSYKSRLERMERRIILSRRHSDITGSGGRTKSEYNSSNCRTENEKLNQLSLTEVFSENSGFSGHSYEEKDSSIAPIPNKRKMSFTEHQNDVKNRRLHNDSEEVSPSPLEFTSPTSLIQSAYAASGYVPVPMSFVDRCCNQFAPMASPDNKGASALTTACIDNYVSPKSITLKVCDHCSQCAVMAAGVKASMPHPEHVVSIASAKPRADVASTSSYGNDATNKPPIEVETSSGAPAKVVMQADYDYHVYNNLRDQDMYRSTELESQVGEDNPLNIPTWRVHKYTLLSHHHHGKDVKEVIDEDAYTKRHGRLEISEKRRKRWDIQRIREYRYNEKLRQKLLKQNADDEFESFAPSLSNVTAIEVRDSLPINVFGHSLMALKREEFSLPSDF